MTVQDLIDNRISPYWAVGMRIEKEKPKEPTIHTIESIEQIVCEYFKLGPEKVHVKTRQRDIVTARHAIFYFTKKYTKKSLSQIGQYFSNMDHTSVLHGCRVVADLCDTDPEYKKDIDNIEQKLS